MTNMHTGQMSVLATVSIGMALGTMALWLAGASAASGPSCPSSARTMARLEMVFGTSRLQSAPVSGEEWARFLDNEVTPRFPDGFTVLQGPGQWRGNDGRLAKEVSNILVIWHEPTRRTEADIESIRSAYKERFDQDSVMRVDSTSCVSF